jgi:hypothetical protein
MPLISISRVLPRSDLDLPPLSFDPDLPLMPWARPCCQTPLDLAAFLALQTSVLELVIFLD